MTKSNKFEHLEINLLRFSFLSIKSWKFGTLKDTMIGFKLEAKKTTPKRYQKLEFQTMSTPTILPYKNPPSGIARRSRKLKDQNINSQTYFTAQQIRLLIDRFCVSAGWFVCKLLTQLRPAQFTV